MDIRKYVEIEHLFLYYFEEWNKVVGRFLKKKRKEVKAG
jgi:hypothetical protein